MEYELLQREHHAYLYGDQEQERDLASSYFDNITIAVEAKNYYSDTSNSYGNYYCKSTTILPFAGNDADYGNSSKDSSEPGQTSIYSNVFWFMSSSDNSLFYDYYMENEAGAYDDVTYLQNTGSSTFSCTFEIDTTSITNNTSETAEQMCYGKGYFLDNIIDPIKSATYDSTTTDYCAEKYDLLDNAQLGMYYLSCGAKHLSKNSGGNTYALITITNTLGDVDREWLLTNENDNLEDFYWDSQPITINITIPSELYVPGPYNEIGCVVAWDKGFGSLAQGVSTLSAPR